MGRPLMDGTMRRGLGLVPPPDTDHLDKYPLRLAARGVVRLEHDTPLHSTWRRAYNQGDEPECVGFSVSEAASLHFRRTLDARYLYAACKARDGYNGPGTYLRVAFDVLKAQGHRLLRPGATPSPAYGVDRFEWATTVDDIRAALAAGNEVVVGTEWYEEMFEPRREGRSYRLPDARQLTGRSVGGHAYLLTGGSDARECFKTPNTWGQSDRQWNPGEPGWPVTEIPYSLMKRLLGEQGEAVVPAWRAAP